jgi:hypothetical protein
MPIERPGHVRVTNTGPDKIRGRFAGEDYEFLPNKPSDIPVHAAAHIFGFGHENKTAALNRLGWLTSSSEMERAMARLNKIVFAESPPLIEADMPEPEDGPAKDLVPVSAQSEQTAPLVSSEAGGNGRGTRRVSPPKTPPKETDDIL